MRPDLPPDDSYRSIHELFAEQVLLRPDAVALEHAGGTLSYSALGQMVDCVCDVLLSYGFEPETRIAVSEGRSPEHVAALLGVLQAGCCYVPLDIELPLERVSFLIEDADVRLVLGDSTQQEAFERRLAEVPFLALDRLPSAKWSLQRPTVTERSLAYVMYTSGSTGVPKGVMVEHRSVVRLVKKTNYFTVQPSDVFLRLAPSSFDAATFEIWAPLLNGARLALAPAGDLTLSAIEDAVRGFSVTVLWLTAGLFHALVDERPATFRKVKQLLAGGDVLSPVHVSKALEAMDGGCVINGYGPTENTTFTCCCQVTPGTVIGESVPIGTPIENTQVYILDSQLVEVAEGESGEICIAGDGLARGYLNRPDLDREAFVEANVGGKPVRLYRSGDLGRVLPSGNIEFGGRIDDQIKLRGFRIEPGEIETAIIRHGGILQACVIAVPAVTGDKQLACCFVAAPGSPTTAEELRHHLRAILPPYMVPSRFMQLEALPLTTNGKVDRRKLQDAALQSNAGSAAAIEFEGEEERALAAMFRELLGIDQIALDDDFFEMGGHSLVAARLFAQIEDRFGKKLPLITVFKAPTVRKLAAVLRQPVSAAADWSTLVPMRTGGRQNPLFLVHAIGGNVLNYQPLDKHLPDDLPIYALQASGLKERRAKAMSIEDMARSYVAAVRSVQPTGPYRFGGYSAGGVLAFEMAQQLTAAGETVSHLLLLDSSVEPSAAASLRAGQYKAAAWRTWRTIWWNLHYMARTDLRFFASRKAQNFWLNIKVLLYQAQGLLRRTPSLLRSTSLLTVEQGFVHALDRYSPKPYAGAAVLFRTRESDFYNPDATLGWSNLLQGGLEVVNADGDHDTMFSEPHIQALSLKIAEFLNGSGTGRPRIELAPNSSLAVASAKEGSSRVFHSA